MATHGKKFHGCKNEKLFLPIFGYLIVASVIIWSFIRYEHMYWLHMTKEYPFSSQYGVKELVNYLTSQEKEGKCRTTWAYRQHGTRKVDGYQDDQGRR